MSSDRMTQNATALVASSVITALLGLLFWVFAARLFTTAEVGTGSAIITSIVLLGNLATLGLRNGLVRFIGAAGAAAGRFIVASYALCCSVALVISVAFIAGTSWWAEELRVLEDEWLVGLCFALGTAVWTMFVLQDNVLTGLRRAIWVPIENLVYSIAKLMLLFSLSVSATWLLPLAWCVPALVLIVPVNILIFRRLLPMHETNPAEPVFTRSEVARFAMGDFGADVIRLLGVEVVVLVVLGARGADDTAYVFFAITVAASGQLVSNNIVTAFVAEASSRPAEAVELARRAAFNIARLIVPGALIGVLVAPAVLGTLGAQYAENGTELLRLMLVDSIPVAVASLAIGWARFRRSVRDMLLIP
ncbi:MAG: lipopolysaccharide biosynthesis protein, partial [Ilumatobacteraceae bacterium]